jgi:hypothetical protein
MPTLSALMLLYWQYLNEFLNHPMEYFFLFKFFNAYIYIYHYNKEFFCLKGVIETSISTYLYLFSNEYQKRKAF